MPAVILDTDRPQPNDDFLIVHLGVFADETVIVEVAVIITGFDADGAFFLDIRKPGVTLCAADAAAFFACFIHVVVCDTKHSALDRRFIEQNRVFHIVSIERHNRYDGIETARVFFAVNEVEVATLYDGDFAVIENDPHFIDTHLIVAVVDRRGLLGLSASKDITCDWVIFWEADLVSHNAHEERWVNFNMGILFAVGG